MDPYQAWRFVGPDLGPNCLQRRSADTALVSKSGVQYTYAIGTKNLIMWLIHLLSINTTNNCRKKYDFIVFGASGYTGRLVVEELVRVLEREDFTMAVADMSEEKNQSSLDHASQYTGKCLLTEKHSHVWTMFLFILCVTSV